ncbi:lanthionine synthetase C family protein [Micromonospora sp. WMMA1363]|uniref:lanthionine synthetase C family protein n=1 Tax=Micromonospora sp. WMMA1363 TaxID=3053985 RepID=UPI00259C70A9|nr:lanthionine synthetase C family protein [Micromonospora sp. WMMA1363]MDM4721386.1 lanthionine synthetase C family protein [Micromonospora sp. WMMA1363]
MSAGQSLADGAAGVALLHLETGNWPAACEALRQSTAGGVSIADGASLFYGAPALAFVLAATDQPGLAQARAITAEGTVTVTRHRLDAAHRRIDRNEQPHFAEYDLIRGLTGLGVALRRLGDNDPLREVLDYLVRLTEPRGSLPGWWCWNGPERQQAAPIGGHANHGIAHGITGPLALLALTMRDRITVDGHAEAITRICEWLDTWQQQTNGTTWWPQTVTLTDLRRGAPAQQAPLRPSWCYGTPGIARAQQLAAQALRDTQRQHLAEVAFAGCVTDPAQIELLSEHGLCHGTAGLLATARRIAADALTPTPLAAIEDLHRQVIPGTDVPEGLLVGTTGADLAAVASTATSWDACLLLA